MNEGLCQPLALFSKKAQTPNIKDLLSNGRKSYANHLWQVSVYHKKGKHGMLWKQAGEKYQTEPKSREGRIFWRAYAYIGINQAEKEEVISVSWGNIMWGRDISS